MRDTSLAVVQRKADCLAMVCYLRWGFVPRQVCDVVDALDALQKYRPDQPRVPAGNPEGGQWTDGDGSTRPRRVDEIYDPPPEPTVAPWDIILPLSIVRNVFGFIARRALTSRFFVIGKQRFSAHALTRMEERGVPPSVVANTIRQGIKMPSRNGTSIFHDYENNVTVVDDKTRNVITVRRGKP